MSRMQRLWYLVGILGAMLIGVYFRTRHYVQVYLPDAVLGVDTDCYYHLRRAYLCARSFPRVPVFDPWLAWPQGASPTWGPGFDQLLAFPAWLLGVRDELAALRLIAAVPVCLGLLVIAAVARLAFDIEPEPKQRAAVSLSAALFAASMPQAVHLSQLGATDHHVVEALAPVLLLGWVIRVPDTRRVALAWEACGALLIAILTYVFPGTLLTHGLISAALGLRFLIARNVRRPDGALAFLGASILLGMMAAGWTFQHGETFHHLQLSALQPLLLAVAGSFLGLLGLVPATGRSPVLQTLFRLSGAGIGLSTLIGVLALCLPGWRHEVVAGVVDWLFTRDPWMASIEECFPLFSSRFSFSVSLRRLWDTQGFTGPLLPVFALLAMRRLKRLDGLLGNRLVLTAVLLLGHLALALAQFRFLRGLSGLVSVVSALGLMEAVSLFRNFRVVASRLGVVVMSLCAVSLGLDRPTREGFETQRSPVVNGLLDAALRFRPTRPVQPGHHDGILTPWDSGFEFLLLSRRPVVLSGFGPYLGRALFHEAENIWSRRESDLLDFLRRRDSGYVVAVSARILSTYGSRALPPFRRTDDGRWVINSALLRARPLLTLALGGSGSASTGVPHIEHLRPRFADRGRVGLLTASIPEVWVYERVAGAVLQGEAPTGALIVANLDLLHHGNRRRWQGWTRAREGRWTIRVPLPTGGRDYGVHTGDHFVVFEGEVERSRVVVTEDDVMNGSTIHVSGSETERDGS